MIYVIKKDKTLQNFDISKVVNAVQKSAYRAIHRFSEEEMQTITDYVTAMSNDEKNWERVENDDVYITVPMMHWSQ